ncbi:hypothetical protein ACFV2X_25155 [Streptomyces sp. NPDC059679]
MGPIGVASVGPLGVALATPSPFGEQVALPEPVGITLGTDILKTYVH